MSLYDLDNLADSLGVESSQFLEEILLDMEYIGTLGLMDELRKDAERSVQLIRYGCEVDRAELETAEDQVTVRLVSGDHHETCKKIAIESGIVTADQAKDETVCMSGETFLHNIGGIIKELDPYTGRYNYELANPAAFGKTAAKLRVLTRATPEHKLALVAGIKELQGLVAMTGTGIADANALQAASVGLSMGTACQAVKDSSDLVILDNDLASVFHAIMWGRTIFENVRKFLQF